MPGIDSNGFTPKTLDETKTSLETSLRTVFGAAINVTAQSVFGQLIGIFSDRLSEVWQLGQAVYSSSFRESAVGDSLDRIGALTLTTRRPATYTTVSVLCSGTPGTVITAGSRVSIPGVNTVFANASPGTIGGGGTVSIVFTCIVTGPFTAYANTVTNIDTPIAGWAACTNPLDHSVLGSNLESDAAYRVRQRADIKGLGRGTIGALRARVSQLAGVTACYVFQNTSDSTVDSMPPHSVEVVALGGSSSSIAQEILNTKPVGIATSGNTSASATDANGFSATVLFTRPTELQTYVVVDVIADAALFPPNGSDLIKQALADYGDANYTVGTEVRSSALLPAVFSACPGVLECGLPKIGTAPSPTLTATINVNLRQYATLDTSRITVNVTLISTS